MNLEPLIPLLLFCQILTGQSLPKYDRIQDAIYLEWEKTHNPETGKVERYKLFEYLEREKNTRNTYGTNWEQIGPDAAGRTRAILITTDYVYAGSVSGGLFRKPRNDTSAIFDGDQITGFENLAITALAEWNGEIWAGTGEGWFNADAVRGNGVYKSSDGLNFSMAYTIPDYVQDLVVFNDSLFIAYNAGVIKTGDGTYYEGINGMGFVGDIEKYGDSLLFSRGYMLSPLVIFKYHKGTLDTFLVIPGARRAVLSYVDSTLWIVSQNQSDWNASVWKYRNDSLYDLPDPGAFGMPNFARSQAWYSIAVIGLSRDTALIGGIDILKTVNGGNAWTQISQWYGCCGWPNVHADQHIFKKDGNKIWIGNDGGVYSYENNVFTNHESGYKTLQLYTLAVQNGELLGGTQDNGTWQITTIESEVTGGDGSWCFWDGIKAITSVYYSNYYVFNGISWTSRFYGNSGRFINPAVYKDGYHISTTNPGQLRKWHIDTSGFTFINLSNPNAQPTAIHFKSDSLLYGNAGKLYYFDGTNSIQLHSSGGYLSSITSSGSSILITYSSYGVPSVFLSTDNGATFTNIEYNLPDIPVRWGLFHNNIFIATEAGVWELSGSQWFRHTSLPPVRTDMLDVENDIIYSATHGKGFWKTEIFGEILPVTLVSFNGKYSDQVVLTWQVSNENVDYYLINGKKALSKGRGQFTTTHLYYPEYSEGWNYYQLSEVSNGIRTDLATCAVFVPSEEYKMYWDILGRPGREGLKIHKGKKIYRND